jgi:Tol biopolymer transport system component
MSSWLLFGILFLALSLIFGCSLVSGGGLRATHGEQEETEKVLAAETQPKPTQIATSQTAQPPMEKPTQPVVQRPTATQTLKPTPTAIPVLLPLTQGGCCVQPFWAPDSQRVLFLDKPIASLPAGLWGVGLQGGAPERVSAGVGIFSPGMQYRAYLQNGVTLVERLKDGQQWQISNGGRLVYFSEDETKLAWVSSAANSALREVWVSQVDGSQAQRVYQGFGASLVNWLADGRILIQEQASDSSAQTLLLLSLAKKVGEAAQVQAVVQGYRLRNPLASPDGRWIAYYATFEEDAEANGIWLADTHSGEKQRLSLFGAYRWRDANHLLVIPLDLEQQQHRLWQVEAATGAAIALTDPELTPFKVGGGDWKVSPDGRWMIFVSAGDNNIWLMKLP